jgi:uncharacterized OsmC-like protein
MHVVEVANKQGNIFEIKAKENRFIIEPNSDNLTPGDVLLASLGSCIGLYTRRYLDNAKIPTQGFSLKLEADFSQDHPVRFKQIKVSLDLGDIQIEPARKAALLKFVSNCPIGNTLKGDPSVEIGFKSL